MAHTHSNYSHSFTTLVSSLAAMVRTELIDHSY